MRGRRCRKQTVLHIVRVLQYRTFIRYANALRCSRPPLRRARILPWRDVVNQEPRVGDLRIEECLDRELHRYVRTARLFDVSSAIYSDKLPELLDVRLTAMSPQAVTLAGFERVAGVEYAQSWLVTAPCLRERPPR